MDFEALIVGGGVVGLAVAEALSQKGMRHILLVDRHPKFGYEASSHNSEVIHAGIYYAHGSLKAESCLKGRDLLYDFCEKHEIEFSRCGKYIVCTDDAQLPELHKILERGLANGVDLELRDFPELETSPHLRGRPAIWSKDSGIVNSHELMLALEARAIEKGVDILYRHNVEAISPMPGGLSVTLVSDGEKHTVTTSHLINSGGLASAKLLHMLWPDSPWTIKPCRGRYFALNARYAQSFPHLIYPLPDSRGGLGVHVTMDLSGRAKLGPDVDWSQQKSAPDNMDLYKFNASDLEQQKLFLESGKRLISQLEMGDLSSDYIGVRAKLFRDGVVHPEFVIVSKENSTHLLGIESPGLTAALSLAQNVAETINF